MLHKPQGQDMKWLLIFVAVFPSMTQGQHWLETVILTQQGPIPYTPTIQHSPHGYYTADVYPVDITKENYPPRQSIAWPLETNTFDVPVFSGVRVKQPTLTISKVMPYSSQLKRKKGSSKKTAEYIKQLQQEKPPKSGKMMVSKPPLELPLDPRSNDKEIKGKYAYQYRGRRFVNRGHDQAGLQQNEKILKGQAMDYTRSLETENYDTQLRYNEQDIENQTPDPTSVIHYTQNDNEGLTYGYFTYPQPNINQEDRNIYYRNNMWQ